MKTFNLTGVALDWAVAKAMNVALKPLERGQMFVYTASTGRAYQPSLDGNLFVILMNAQHISVECGHSGIWLAYDLYNYTDEKRHMCSGLSMQEAAMRCLVTKHLGDNIIIPKELRT